MEVTHLPSALFSSCTNSYCPKELIKQILAVDTLPEGKTVIEKVEAFDWHIETKYYTSDIQLCITNHRTFGDEDFSDSVQAFILYFDPEDKNSFELVKAWLSFLKLMSPPVQLLVCDKCTPTSVVDRLTVQNWCIDNEFELVELSPEEENSDSEDDFGETTGVKRIIQALHAHTWPNLKLKENPNVCSPYMRQLMKEQAEANAKQQNSDSDNGGASNSASNTCDCKNSVDGSDTLTDNNPSKLTLSHSATNQSESCCNSNSENKDSIDTKKKEGPQQKTTQKVEKPKKEDVIDSLLPMDDNAMFGALCSDDPEGESFEQLFEKFRLMKEKAEHLPPDERKAYAEKVAISFWKAIGGDEDEIDGLTDSDAEL